MCNASNQQFYSHVLQKAFQEDYWVAIGFTLKSSSTTLYFISLELVDIFCYSSFWPYYISLVNFKPRVVSLHFIG